MNIYSDGYNAINSLFLPLKFKFSKTNNFKENVSPVTEINCHPYLINIDG